MAIDWLAEADSFQQAVERESLLNKKSFAEQAKELPKPQGLLSAAALKQETRDPVAQSVVERLGAGSEDNLLKFAEMVKQIESDGRADARNPNSSAKGHFQYINASVQPAINRAKRYFKETPVWLSELEKHKDVTRLTDGQATQLFLADISEKKGTDKFLKKAAAGDIEAMKTLYKRFHHTKPDKDTLVRLDKFARKLG
jgi:hypothetical protein